MPAGGGNVPSMGSRVTRLEASIVHIERDIADIKIEARSTRESMDRLRDRVEDNFRITWAGIIALGLGQAALLAKGLGWF